MFICFIADPNLILPIGLVFGSVTVLFIISIIIYYIFQIDIVLGFRRTFPILYTNKGNTSQQVFNLKSANGKNALSTTVPMKMIHPHECFMLLLML